MSRWVNWIGVLSITLLLVSIGWAEEPEPKEAPPSFKPGAEVELVFEIIAPEEWHLNEGMPLSVSFDEKYLKEDAPFTTKTPKASVSTKPGATSTEVSLVIMLNPDVTDGALKLPIKLACVVCDESGDACLMVKETISAKLVVLSQAPQGTKHQAQTSGENPVAFQIPAVD